MWVTPSSTPVAAGKFTSTDPGSISAAESKSGRSSPEAHNYSCSQSRADPEILTYPGEAISDGILQMGDTRQMYVVAEVYETDVGLVKLGQPPTITSRNGAFNTR